MKLVNISKKFKNNLVLDNISLEIKEKSIYGLLGLNGAGKSTLLKIISNIISSDTGEIIFESNEKRIGFMIEEPSFFPDISGYNNLKLLSYLYDDVSEARIISVLTTVGLYRKKDELYKNYSLGMKQRLYFAYALMNNPNILILDEPFNGIDPLTLNLFKDIIVNFKELGGSVIISSHIISEIQDICTDCIILDNGKITLETKVDKDTNLQDLFVKNVSSNGLI